MTPEFHLGRSACCTNVLLTVHYAVISASSTVSTLILAILALNKAIFQKNSFEMAQILKPEASFKIAFCGSAQNLTG